MSQKSVVLLLLSGGKDSHQSLQILLSEGHEVHCLCIDGIQGKERIGAEEIIKQTNSPLEVVTLSFFDEETWNPFKLVMRDLAMGFIALRMAKRVKATKIATGVKLADLADPALWWLRGFLKLGAMAFKAFGIELVFPVWLAPGSIKKKPKKIKLIYSVFRLLPQNIRYAFYRKKFAVIPTRLPDGLTFQLARSKEDLEAAFKLLHDVYVEQGLIEPQPSGMRLLVQHALPSTSILIAKMEGRVVGTLSVMRDTQLKLPMEKVFDISHLKKKGKRVAEFSSLAIHPDYRRKMSGHIFFPLTLFAASYAKNYFGTDYLVFNLCPHHADFYNGIFGSTHLNEIQAKKEYLGAEALGMQLDLESVVKFARDNYAGLPPERDLFSYTFVKKHEHFKFPKKEEGAINHPVMTPDIFRYFFAEKTCILDDMNDLETQVMNGYYPLESYLKILPFKRDVMSVKRNHERWDIRIIGKCDTVTHENKIKIVFLDISLDGFKAYVEGNIALMEDKSIEVGLINGPAIKITAKAVWKTEDNVYGFNVTSLNDEWERLVEIQEKVLFKMAS